MVPLLTRFAHCIKHHRLIAPTDRLVVGVSGGPDSIALLMLLTTWCPPRRLAAAYIDHGLRPTEAAREQRLVDALCARLHVAYHHVAIDVESERRIHGESVEACGRRLRYQALEQIRVAAGADLIAVGHTRDDQVEEVLLRLIRGTGRAGLTGMARKNDRIIRPLLDFDKATLLDYLHHRNIEYCLDSSNRSRRFLRNRVRLDLLPLLERDYNPAIRRTIIRSTEILATEEAFLQEDTEQQYEKLVDEQTDSTAGRLTQLTITLTPFRGLHRAQQRRLIEKACRRIGTNPDFAGIERVIACGEHGRTGTVIELPQGRCAIKQARSLVLMDAGAPARRRCEPHFGAPVPVGGPGRYDNKTLGIRFALDLVDQAPEPDVSALVADADLVPFPLTLRAAMPGERLVPCGAPGRKTVARLLGDRKIPRHQRHRYPVLATQDALVAIPGVSVADPYRISEHTKRFLVIWRNDHA